MPELLERLTTEIGQLVVKVHALNGEIERLNEELAKAKEAKTGEVVDYVPKPKTRQKTDSQAQAGNSPAPA